MRNIGKKKNYHLAAEERYYGNFASKKEKKKRYYGNFLVGKIQVRLE